ALAQTQTTADGRTYEVTPAAPAGSEAFLLHIHVGLLDSSFPSDSTVTHRFRRLRAGEMGEISGVVRRDSATTGEVLVDVRAAEKPRLVIPATIDQNGAFLASGLRPGRYILRTFVDLDG